MINCCETKKANKSTCYILLEINNKQITFLYPSLFILIFIYCKYIFCKYKIKKKTISNKFNVSFFY